MYHCGTPPVLMQIAPGMYGAVVIDPPGLEPVDHEYVMVQSELYTGKGGDIPDMAKPYAFVTHKFNDATRGAVGVFQVG